MAQTGLEPRIQKLQIRAVPIDSGGSVLIRAARSYNAPHRVIFKGKNRFWARSSARKYEPNVDELRAMFTLAPRLAERMRDFRMERIARIAAGDTPVRLLDEGCLVLHEVILEDVPSKDPDCAKKLHPTLDQLANAAGRSESASFDQSGNFTLGDGGHLP